MSNIMEYEICRRILRNNNETEHTIVIIVDVM